MSSGLVKILVKMLARQPLRPSMSVGLLFAATKIGTQPLAVWNMVQRLTGSQQHAG